MTTANLSLDVVQSAHACMAFVDAELFDLPEAERIHLVEVLTGYLDERRRNPTPRYLTAHDRGSRQTRLLLARIAKGGGQ